MQNSNDVFEAASGPWATRSPFQHGQKIEYKYKGKKFMGIIKGINPSDMDELLVDPGDGVLDAINVKDVIKRLRY